ncbi:MAG: hypothetical protein KIT17_15400 [Rubrivivax sp.]|nr:hypothetical protein [Rubrivivax sp.]
MPAPKAQRKATSGDVAPPGYWPPPVKHPKFTDVTRRALSALLRDNAAAARIEAACVFEEDVQRYGIDMGGFLFTLARVERGAGDLLQRMQALQRMHGFAAASLCMRPAFEQVAQRRPWLLRDEHTWGDVLVLLEALAAGATDAHAQWKRPGKRGRKRDPATDALGRAIVAAIVAHGVQPSAAARSRLVRAVAIVFAALGINLQAQSFVASVLE